MGVTVVLDGQGADELIGGYYSSPYRKFLLDILRNYGFNYYLQQVKKIAEIYPISKGDVYSNTIYSLSVEIIKNLPRYYYSKNLRIGNRGLT